MVDDHHLDRPKRRRRHNEELGDIIFNTKIGLDGLYPVTSEFLDQGRQRLVVCIVVCCDSGALFYNRKVLRLSGGRPEAVGTS